MPAVGADALHDCMALLTLDDGTRVAVRPVRPGDEPALAGLHRQVSEQTVRFRYFADLPLQARIAHARLERICHPDPERGIVLVAVHCSAGGDGELIGVARLDRQQDRDLAELALLVADRWQRRTLGAHLLDMLLAIARNEGLGRVFISFLPENRIMRLLCDHRDFAITHPRGEPFVRAELRLR
jgi:acetyltransferase